MNKQQEKQQQILNNNNISAAVTTTEDDKIYYNNFYYSFKTDVTRKTSLLILKYYMKFLGVTTLRELVDIAAENKPKSQKIIESDIKAYLVYLRTTKKIAYGSAALYLSVIKKFYVVNTDYLFKWNLINMYLGNDDTTDDDGDNNGYNNNNNNDHDLEEGIIGEGDDDEEEDRPYSRSEIQKMFNAAQDIRTKIIISL